MRMMKLLLILFACTATSSSPASAGPFEDAVAAYKNGDYVTAARLFRPIADQGNAGAQYNLGLMYEYGRGLPQDDRQAVAWYRAAANQGHEGGQCNLGLMYANGRGVPKDYAQAVTWYRKAANQENPSGQTNLGLMYAEGKGVPKDYVEAHKWLNLAASGFLASQSENRIVSNTRDKLERIMTPAQIAEAQKLAREWKPKP